MKDIPVIDISLAKHGSVENKRKIAFKLDRACKEIGFFSIIGHGIDKQKFNDTFRAMKEFFSLSNQVKLECKLKEGFTLDDDDYMPYGYSGILEENAYAYVGEKNMPNDYVEKFSVGRRLFNGDPKLSQLLSSPYAEKITNQAKIYFNEIENLSNTIAELFTYALDLPDNYFKDKINNSTDCMRLLRYPAFNKDFNNNQGMGAHTDGTFLTFVADNHPGIEVMNTSGEWVRPTVEEDRILVNIGDVMMRWSNDYYLSTKHRVVLNNKDRYAAIFFKLVNDDTVLDPFKKFCEKEPAKYKPETYKKFGLDKMNALYGKE